MANFEDQLSHQLQMNAEQIKQRRELGDVLAEPREIDHFAVFKSQANAKRAIDQLESAGYSLTEMKGRLFKVSVSFTAISPVDETTAEAFTREVFGIIARNSGAYDGWGGEAVIPDH